MEERTLEDFSDNELVYLEYLYNHGHNIMTVWDSIQFLLLENGLINEEEMKKIHDLIINHDASKLGEKEFSAYADFHCGKKANKEEYQEAWKHHKEKNLHHHQSLKNYRGYHWKPFVVEMECDWMAMSIEIGDTAYDYYENNKDKIVLPNNYLEYLLKILVLIKERDLSNVKGLGKK